MSFARVLFKRPAVLATFGGVLVLLVAWWFAWMSPVGGKLSSVRAKQAQDVQTQADLQARLTELERDASQVKSAGPAVKLFSAALPETRDAPGLVVQVYHLAQQDQVKLESITDNSVTPTSSGYSTMPVTITVSGSHDNVLSFVEGLYGLPRLLTLQGLSLSGSGDLNAASQQNYSASITATAYTLATATTSPAAG